MLTVPQIVVTKVCPPTAVRPGEVLQYSGTVSNAGNITLVDVTIVNTQPSAGSPVLGPITLAPGESVTYYASYLVSPDFCGTDTVTARGLDACTFAPVVNSVTTTCPVMTTPRIFVTKNCPPEPTPHLGVLIFTGTVSNPGNVTLTNVFVVNNQPSNNTPVIGPITLAPGASVNFTGSYTAPQYCCEIVDTLTARGQDRCSGEPRDRHRHGHLSVAQHAAHHGHQGLPDDAGAGGRLVCVQRLREQRGRHDSDERLCGQQPAEPQHTAAGPD